MILQHFPYHVFLAVSAQRQQNTKYPNIDFKAILKLFSFYDLSEKFPQPTCSGLLITNHDLDNELKFLFRDFYLQLRISRQHLTLA